MAERLSVASVVEKNRIASAIPWLLMLDIDVKDPTTNALVETLRFVRNNEDFTYEGNLYTAANFDIEFKHEASAAPEMTLTVRDYNRALQARMQAYGGGVGFGVRMLIVNSGNPDQPPEIAERFIVLGASASDYVISWTLGAENPLLRRFPGRMQWRDRCAWRYKGPECGYIGPLESCDLSLQGPNGCTAHNNSPNFGGFPGINPSFYRVG